jgi:hypothetical protein
VHWSFGKSTEIGKLIPKILKFFGTSHFSQNNNKKRISVLLKTRDAFLWHFCEDRTPKNIAGSSNFTQNIIEGTLLLPLQKSAPILLDFCEKLTPQLEFWRSSFSTKDNRKSVQVLRAISLGFNGKRVEWKHYSKITLWKLRKRISFSYHRRELIVYATSFFVLWYQQSETQKLVTFPKSITSVL